jgi:hypothetical protein
LLNIIGGIRELARKKTIEYQIQHPKWQIYKKSDVSFTCDFQTLYGNKWKFLNQQKPHSMFVAKGSNVSVGFPKSILLNQ